MRIDGLNAPVQILQSNSIKQFPKEGVGDVIKAQVVGRTESEVLLRLENGNVIPASTEIPLDVQIGDTIELMIKSKQDGKIFLETLKNENGEIIKNQNTEQIKNLLSSLGFTSNPKNIEVVNEMMAKQIPLTRENVQAVMNGILKFSTLDIPKAVFMLANNIPFEEKKIEMLSQYQDGKIKLGNQIKSLMSMLDRTDDTDILKGILQRLNRIDEGYKNKVLDTLIGETIKYIQKVPERNIHNITGQPDFSKLSADENLPKNIINDGKSVTIKQEQIPLIKKVITDRIDILTNALKIKPDENFDSGLKEIKNSIINMNNDEFGEIIKQIPKNEKEVILKLLGNMQKDRDIFAIKTEPDIKAADAESIKKEIKSHFQKHFINISSESLKDDLNITESYKALMGNLEAVKDSIQVKTETLGIRNLIGQTQDNINFMKDMSQYNAFVQIPLNIWGNETNGQLFVLKKDKRKIDPANASIFLSLDMPNIGLTEVFVKIQGKNVDCSFRMENQDLVSFLKENANKLIQSLNVQGYRFISVNCSLIEKKTGIIEADKGFENSDSGKKISIDVKV